MKIEIKNCNSIDEAKIQLAEGKLNLKYAVNGTGKTTIARAILLGVTKPESLRELLPFKYLGKPDGAHSSPLVTGIESLKSIRIFDEKYINQFIFRPDEIIANSFEIFIRTDEYDEQLRAIEASFHELKDVFANDSELDAVIVDLRELSASFGKSAGGYSKASSLHKGIGGGNKLENIPPSLEQYKGLLQSASNVKWLKWQVGGKEFLDISDDCPYCVAPTDETKKKLILSIEGEYDSKTIEHLNGILKILESLADYFSSDTREMLQKITMNKTAISPEEIEYLKGLKQEVDIFESKLSALKNLSFFSFRDVDKVVDKISDQIIKIEFLTKLKSPKTEKIAESMNASLDALLKKAIDIQRLIGVHRSSIQKTIRSCKDEVNLFLQYAGYKYVVEIDGDDNIYKMRLRHVDYQEALKNGNQHLSYGEKNAFSLVLFMYEVIKENPDLVVLDDPISSFDKNKKFAILNALFRGNRSFKDMTVLMLTHDLEPIIDVIHSLANKFNLPSATFLHSADGVVNEMPIDKEDIITFSEVCKQNIASPDCDAKIKLIYLRRDYEVKGEAKKYPAYQLLSNLMHKRLPPEWREGDVIRNMTADEVEAASVEIAELIPGFEYGKFIEMFVDEAGMISLYKNTSSNYEKLQIYRIINDAQRKPHKSEVISKFINEVFHIENEYLMQLNPRKYQVTPKFIIDECDKALDI